MEAAEELFLETAPAGNEPGEDFVQGTEEGFFNETDTQEVDAGGVVQRYGETGNGAQENTDKGKQGQQADMGALVHVADKDVQERDEEEENQVSAVKIRVQVPDGKQGFDQAGQGQALITGED